MIYILDEKTNRQLSYGWDAEKFESYNCAIKSIRDFTVFDVVGSSDAILESGNIVLFHESFFNGIESDKRIMSDAFQEKMYSYAKAGIITVAYFGGSKRSRKVSGQIVYLPVSVLYEHLEVFVKKVLEGQGDIKYLLWGNNPNIEKRLLEKIKKANESVETRKDYSGIETSALLIVPADKQIKLVLPGLQTNLKELFPDPQAQDPVSDELLHSDILEWLNEKRYEAIVLPLCFGPALSDYNGLRLAMHIRCTPTPNQCVPIYIYSAADLSNIIHNEYFDIVKTDGVELINYDNESIVNALERTPSTIRSEILVGEMKKIHLNLPENYIDSHSVANEWAIYRWAKSIGVRDSDIERVSNTVESNLYFKYLNTIYPVPSQEYIKAKDLAITTDSAKKPKVLLVDDEAEKGWYEIFRHLFYDLNHFDFDYVDDELNDKTPKEIVDIVHKKIIDDNIDIVILDFRLHRSDFFANKIEDITGYNVLCDIKKRINRGIQVIILSASNKVWNWEALRDAGADAFIIKDNPEYMVNDGSVNNNIQKFIKQINRCCRRTFLKKAYKKINQIKELIRLSDCFNYFEEGAVKDKRDEACGHLDIAFDLLSNSTISNEYKAYTYLQLFLLIEEYANLPSVFDDSGNDLFLLNGIDRYHILKDKQSTKTGQFKWRSVLTFSSGSYILGEDDYEKRYIETNYRISALLIFKFGECESNTHNWNNINKIRNNKAAHPKTKNVSIKEIDQILDFMLFFFNNKNAKWRPLKDAFPTAVSKK